MRSARTTHRAGMSLVELLVVVAILGLLAITVIPALSTASDSRRTREATRILTSAFAKAQSRAIGRKEWAGFWLVPPNSAANFAMDLHLADVPAAFAGDTLTTTVSGSVSGSAFVITSGSLSGSTVTGTTGDLVRFDGQGPWYAFLTANAVGLRNGAAYGSTTLENAGQSLLNTAWPAASAPHTFELLRQPIRAGSPLTLTDGRCIDLRWSGSGGSSLTYATFGASPGSIAVLFDGTGRLRQLFFNGARVNVTGALFFLVGRSDRAGNAPANLSAADDSLGANWQYPDSYWIAIDPVSGIAKSAECASQSGLSTDDVFASQTFIRSELDSSGR